MSETETKIIMVGPSGVGKTSLLASMYSHIRREVAELGCTFLSSAACSNELDERKQELERLATGKALTVDLNLGPKPGQDKRIFEFKLHVRQGIPDIVMQFIDLPGGWFLGKGEYEEAERLIAQSQVIIVAVDAWALMEMKDGQGVGKYNMQVNKPRVICEALERASIALTGAPPLILFVLVKAEKYLHNDQADELFAAAKSCYGPLIEPLIKRNHPIAGCWVETVGGLELNSVFEKDGMPHGKFMRLRGDKGGYQPRHCSVPLRLVFKLALNKVISDTKTIPDGFWGSFWEVCAKIVGKETELSKNIMKHTKLKEVAEHLTKKLSGEPLAWFNETTHQ